MKKILIILILVLFAGALAFIMLGISSSDPRYQGRTATGWALVLYTSPKNEGETAKQALRNLGSNAAPSLIRMFNKTNESVSDKIFWVVAPRLPGKMRTRAYEKHFPLEPARVRVAAANALQVLGPEARTAIPDLCEGFYAKTPVSDASAYALAAIGKESIPKLIATTQSTNTNVQAMAIFTLGHIGMNGGEATPALFKCLNHGAPTTRTSATNAILKIGLAAVPHLRQILDSGDQSDRLTAAKMLGLIKPSNYQSIEMLKNALADKDPAMRHQALESLRTLRAVIPSVVTATSGLLNDTNTEVRLEAVKLIERAGPRAQTVVPQLTPLLNDPDMSVRTAASAALTAITNAPATNGTIVRPGSS